MIPGLGSSLKGVDVDRGEREMRRAVAIIDSMTPQERREPGVINGSRRKRIAKGSGTGGGREPPAEAVRAGAKLMKQHGRAGPAR